MWTGIILAYLAAYFLIGFIAAYPLLASEDHDEQKVGAWGLVLWPVLVLISMFYWWFIWRPHRKWLRDRKGP